MQKAKARPMAVVILLGVLGILMITLGAITIILTLGGLLFALLGITDIDLGEVSGSSAEPISVWGAFLFGAVIGLVILLAGIGTFVQRKTKPAKSKLPPFPY